jgi:hypothetical protein
MRIGPIKTFIMVLREKIIDGVPVSQDEKDGARDRLRKSTGQDFGYDAEKWEEWIKSHMPDTYH